MATSEAEVAAWVTSGPDPPTKTASTIASSTTSDTCQAPRPITRISASPSRMPTALPATISKARRSRCPIETASTTTAAIGAKNGSTWPEQVVRDEPGQARPRPPPEPPSPAANRTRCTRSRSVSFERCVITVDSEPPAPPGAAVIAPNVTLPHVPGSSIRRLGPPGGRHRHRHRPASRRRRADRPLVRTASQLPQSDPPRGWCSTRSPTTRSPRSPRGATTPSTIPGPTPTRSEAPSCLPACSPAAAYPPS